MLFRGVATASHESSGSEFSIWLNHNTSKIPFIYILFGQFRKYAKLLKRNSDCHKCAHYFFCCVLSALVDDFSKDLLGCRADIKMFTCLFH